MKSTTCHKQTTTSLTSAPFAASGSASHHRHHPNQYRNNSINCKDSTNSGCNDIKMRPNDANNNDSNSMMMTTRTTTAKTTSTSSLPIITSTPTRNSKNSEKYSLRQRQKRSFTIPSSSAMPVMSSELKTALTLDEPAISKTLSHRSNLNSTTKPRSNTSTSSSKEKSKSKAAPLSKYRRKTANARERTRMREINSAFENLRHCVPHTITGDQTASSNEKLTKITTLRLAMKYIRVLSQALENPSFQEDFLLECHNDGDHRFSTPNWVQTPIYDVAINSEEDIPQAQPTSTPQARPNKQRKAKTQTTKVPSKRQRTKTKVEETVPQYSHSSSTFSSPFSSSSSSSAYASMSASPLFDDCHSMTDLSSMILESDGESLHLSEPCLSPMNRNYNLGLPSLDRITPNLLKTTPVTMETENPLELSLRLLEPDADSLDFSTDQQPSSCISPLATLDSFNPFGDFLHVEFPEHSSLDLFLT